MTEKFNIILDIDETLIKTYIYGNSFIDNTKKLISFEQNMLFNIYRGLEYIVKENTIIDDPLYLIHYNIEDIYYVIFIRPNLFEFIQTINLYFTIHIYSLGSYEYILRILNCLEEKIGHKFYDQFITNNDSMSLRSKQMSKISLSTYNTLIIDDRHDVWTYDKHILYNIKSYDNYDIDDYELLKLIDIMHTYYKENNLDYFNIYRFRHIIYMYEKI
jgi:TFIIF-interacting CTD phosphatase-like protein